MLSEPISAWVWTERCVAWSVLLQTLELIQLRRAWADDGVYRFALLEREYAVLPTPLRQLCSGLLKERAFSMLLGARVLGAVALGAGLSQAALVLWASQVAVCVRFRGTFNGGSDYMTVQSLLALAVASIGGTPAFALGALYYIAVQCTLSYFVAGIAKLKQASFWSGQDLRAFVLLPQYGAPALARRALESALLRRWAAWSLLVFECGFPFAWSSPGAGRAWLVSGVLFHALNFWVFGLNRFFWAWLATYPAVWFSIQRVAQAAN